jgi:hypothetical protein
MNRSIGLDAQPENFDASSGIAGLFNGCKAHHVSARSAQSMKTFPNNSRKQPSLTYLRRRVEFMRLRKVFIFVAKNTERFKER